ncbi:MFS transporter [Parabacteroides sp. FAFU027]|uniref:MFS transporter n=1 Tax=Parabacteroides sp. FAFU027 TaxID=2922715 RepID=UPI001FAFBD0C|nr:MFS transporter [Parabacteroides sp. FAFU027]
MSDIRENSNPFIILILVLPYGISGGFVLGTLPYLLTRHGFSVAMVASMVALGGSANILRFLWAPMCDLSLSLNKWYIIGNIFGAASLLLFSFIPLDICYKTPLTILIFISQIAANLIVTPVGGFMAKTIREERLGMAGGYWQAGNLGGGGLGAGAGIWLATHFSYHTAIIVLCGIMISSLFAIRYMPQIQAVSTEKLTNKIRLLVSDIRELIHSPVALYTSCAIITPIGIGAAGSLWSAVYWNWQVGAETLALTIGILNLIVSSIGCLVGGIIADKSGKWTAFFSSGILLAMTTLLMSISSFVPANFVGGVLLYAFACGINYAAFSAVVLHAIGKGVASTKYALLSSLGNIPGTCMTAFDGWMHDNYGIKGMLWGETVIGVGFVILFLSLLEYLKTRKIRV